MPVDYKMAHQGSTPTPEYLKSVGLDPASEVLAKAKSALAAFADAVVALDGLAKRIAALEAQRPEVDQQTRLAKLNGGAK
jgi:hypothetical protein